jgi:hypothetical protein
VLKPLDRAAVQEAVSGRGNCVEEQVFRWLVEYNDVMGIHFQNWMSVMAAIVVLEIVDVWIRKSFGSWG